MPPVEIEHGLNDRLPFDVNVLSVEPALSGFHARHDALSRRYLYRISRRRTAFDKRFVWWVKDRLDLPAMKEAASLFPGRHDFTSFCENPEGHDSTVVVVQASEMALAGEGREIHYRIEASHFLWKMVRRIVGTLVEVGRGHIGPDEVARLLRSESSGATAAWTAPPSGLFLEEIRYGTPVQTKRGSSPGAPPRPAGA